MITKRKKKVKFKKGKANKVEQRKKMNMMTRMCILWRMHPNITNQELFLKHLLSLLKKMHMMHLCLDSLIRTFLLKSWEKCLWNLYQLLLVKFSVQYQEANLDSIDFIQNIHWLSQTVTSICSQVKSAIWMQQVITW